MIYQGKTRLFGEITQPDLHNQPQLSLDLGRGFLAVHGRATFDLQELIENKTPILKRVEEAGIRIKNLSLHDELIRSPVDFQEDEFAAVLAPLESQLLPMESCPIGEDAHQRCVYAQEVAELLTLETRPGELVSHAGGTWLFSKQAIVALPEHLKNNGIKTQLSNGKSLPYVAVEPKPEVSVLRSFLNQAYTSKCLGCRTRAAPFPASFVAKPEDESGIIQVDMFCCGNHNRLHPYYFPLGDAIDWMNRFKNKLAFTRVHNSESEVFQLAQNLIALLSED